MASYNRVILVGNLTRDIELRYTAGGTAVTDVGMAVNDRRKTATGEWVDETTFVDVTLWGRTAEVASEYLSKGSPILVEGRLKLDTWESEGQKRSKLRVVCDRMQMLSSGRTREGAQTAEHGMHYDSSPMNEPDFSRPEPSRPEPSRPEPSRPARESAGAAEAQPTGGGAGYNDPEIPF
ncbi:single-stranded DNA-binding protein [Stieleria varia]|uniref:Single-stranded DNA-binding protein n=1 Tax=Stieleria varia TaxID=2528005 RepID=A0A5C6AYQ6_9BACT|nr:single-stranded DNA-binding protein [Stieleria varia]TWU05113.1 Single-stranded DNA-binding protein [Stieleria varia]